MDATLTRSITTRSPRGLDPQRAWRWCMLATVRRARRARRRGKPISQPNLERAFLRHWAHTAPHCLPPVPPVQYEQWRRQGRTLVRNGPMVRLALRRRGPGQRMPA
ncbi:MAG: hypothetical protein ACODAQ_02240 [Phycisphaeraceae bacterium]